MRVLSGGLEAVRATALSKAEGLSRPVGTVGFFALNITPPRPRLGGLGASWRDNPPNLGRRRPPQPAGVTRAVPSRTTICWSGHTGPGTVTRRPEGNVTTTSPGEQP